MSAHRGKETSRGKAATSEIDLGCVKTRLSRGRSELFSQLPTVSSIYQCDWFRNDEIEMEIYAQVQRLSFHTGWTRKRHAVSRDDICRVQERFSVIELCLLKLGCWPVLGPSGLF